MLPTSQPLTAFDLMREEFKRRITIDETEQAGTKDESLGLLDWTKTHRPYLIPDRLFNLKDHAYLLSVYQDKAKIKVIYKAAQMGASEYAISYSFWSCDEREATVMYVFPTANHISEFSAGRFGPAIEASPHLISIVGQQSRGRKTVDRVSIKRVKNRMIYLRGAQVKPDGRAPQLKSVDADILILDELDEMPASAIPIAEKRTGGYGKLDEHLFLSTPSYPNMGIHAKWLESDQKEWFVPCPSCDHKQTLSINLIVNEWDELERPINWNGYPDKAWFACERCRKPLNRLALGEWVATYPKREISGYHLVKFMSYQAKILDVVKSLQTTNETRRKEIYNQDLGEPYVPRGGQLTDGVLNSCVRQYRHGLRAGVSGVVMGIDVGLVLNIVIRGPQQPETGERPQYYAGVEDSFERAVQLAKQYNVSVIVIDALPETRKAKDLQSAFPRGMVWLAYYQGNIKGPDCAKPNKKDGIINIDRTWSMDLTYSRFYEQENTLPAHAAAIPDYYEQLKAPVRVVENNKASYIESKPDHYAHAENYCMVASMDILARKKAEVSSYQG